MLAAVVLASFLAQAEQAPAPVPEPVPVPMPVVPLPPPASAAPLPAPSPAAPLPQPAAPAPQPAAPAPAATAPPPAAAPPGEAPAPRGMNFLSVLGQVTKRTNAGTHLDPTVGFTVGGSFERRLPSPALGLDYGLAVDFLYTRFATTVSVANADGRIRSLSETSFAALGTLARSQGKVRPWAAFGVGGLIAYFSNPAEVELQPQSYTAFQPLARAVAGVDIALMTATWLTLRADYSYMFTHPTFNTGTRVLSFLGDLISAGAGLRLGF